MILFLQRILYYYLLIFIARSSNIYSGKNKTPYYYCGIVGSEPIRPNSLLWVSSWNEILWSSRSQRKELPQRLEVNWTELFVSDMFYALVLPHSRQFRQGNSHSGLRYRPHKVSLFLRFPGVDGSSHFLRARKHDTIICIHPRSSASMTPLLLHRP